MEEVKLKGGIFITTKDIQVIQGCSLRTAQRVHNEMRKKLGLLRKKITVIAYCEYWGIDYKMVVDHINPYR